MIIYHICKRVFVTVQNWTNKLHLHTYTHTLKFSEHIFFRMKLV